MSLILGLETSCDETAAALIAEGRHIRANIVASQIELHRQYGGVYPELASRQHVLDIVPVIEQAMAQAQASWQDLDAIAVACGPGLVGSLLVGVNTAKALSWSRRLPLLAINHLEAHLYANWLIVPGSGAEPEHDPPAPRLPAVCLIVSGGHTDLLLMESHGQYRPLGHTVDDAAGEAFDKVARLLGLGYPGGPAIQEAATGGDPRRFALPRPMLDEGYDFSFSGLKTAVLHIVQEFEGQEAAIARSSRSPSDAAQDGTPRLLPVADLAASFQKAVVDVLVAKTDRASREFQVDQILLAGGVASNRPLREEMRQRCSVHVRFPPPALCTDNAAMVACAGHFRHLQGDHAALALDVVPRLGLTERMERTA